MTEHFEIVPMKTDEEMDGKAFVHWKSWQETYTGLMPQAYVDALTLEQAASWAHRWPQNTLVLKKGDKVLGFSCFSTSDDSGSDQTGEVIALYVLGDYQGRGLGLELMKATMDRLADKREVILWVLRGNEKAIRFYQRYGFRFDKTERTKAFGTELRMVLER
ncbi:MAG: GNAT family N-acetyltransferase [Clostridiaceae bacterium]|jgi:ribosomal protein S18 acetylase RimI-like enzyme|nr:GNAT family N-acetyltransferase [Clostridiaceae bacterium]